MLEENKPLKAKILSSSASIVISLSLVLFVVGLLGLILINAQKLSDYIKENIGFKKLDLLSVQQNINTSLSLLSIAIQNSNKSILSKIATLSSIKTR